MYRHDIVHAPSSGVPENLRRISWTVSGLLLAATAIVGAIGYLIA